jgi:tight adherence protein B
MTLLAALCVGTFCALLAGALAGTLPPRGSRRRARPANSFVAVRRERLGVWLQQTGVTLTPRQFVGLSAGAGVLAMLALGAITGSFVVAFVPAVAVSLLPRAYLGHKRTVRMRAVLAAWPDGLRDLLASISAGRSLTQAVTTLAQHGPPTLREAFARFPELARVLGTTAALEIVKEELADATSDRILEVLILAHERGGGIVRAILEDLVDATTKDLKLLEELETEGLEMRINARAVVVLPWLVLVALTVRPGAFRDFYRSGGGVVTVLVAAALSIVGVLVLGRLGREPHEQRVFASRSAR